MIVAPATVRAGADLDRHRLAGQHRLVDGGRALDDDAVGRDLLARAGRRNGRRPRAASTGTSTSVAVAEHAGLLRAELEQGADRLARAAARAELEAAAEQDQRRDHGGDLEVRVRVDAADEDDRRPASRRRACRPRSACPSSRRRGARSGAPRDGTRQPAQNTTGVASTSATHSQPSNCSGGTIVSSDERRRQQRPRRRAASAPPGPASGVVDVVTRQRGVVAGRLDGRDQVVDRHRRRDRTTPPPARSRS